VAGQHFGERDQHARDAFQALMEGRPRPRAPRSYGCIAIACILVTILQLGFAGWMILRTFWR
jgi:hypothetical protein